MSFTSTKEGLAALILSLPYNQLRAVAADLNAICTEGEHAVGVPVDAEDFLKLLHCWAEAQ